MSVQARVLETIQIGVESTPGEAVAATKKLAAVNLEPQTDIDVEMYGPQGIKTDTMSIFNRERASASLSGKPTYNELTYLAACCLAAPVSDAIQYQTLEVTGSPDGGTFTVKYDDEESGTIDHDATAAEVLTVLEAMDAFAPGDLGASGGPLNTAAVKIHFIGPQFLGLADANIPNFTLETNSLTNGSDPSVTVAQAESSSAYAWVFEPDVDGMDSVKTLTVESAGVVSSFEFAYGLVNQLGINVSRAPGGNSIDLSGAMLGKAIDFTSTPTAGLSALDLVPMTPLQFSCYLDTTGSDDFGTTQFTDGFRVNWVYGPKFQLKESLDASEQSFTAHYEGKVPSTLELQLERNTTATALLTTLRNGGTVYFRLHGVGDEIEDGVPYQVVLDFAAKLTNPNMGVESDLSTITFTLSNVFDATWAKSLRFVLVNELSAL